MSLTPNYFTGFGEVKAVFGAQPTPTHGPNAGPGVGAGDVDFGNILAGVNYLYKYAAHVSVQTNDSSGFKLYAEGAADFFNTADSTTTPLSQTLYWANSTSGTPADTNTGFTAGLPFQKTGSVVVGNSYAGPVSINYGGSYPASAIATSVSANADYYYDFLLKTPVTATSGLYFTWVVYTVVAS
jgi:hypothetical protein